MCRETREVLDVLPDLVLIEGLEVALWAILNKTDGETPLARKSRQSTSTDFANSTSESVGE